eukprot:CAMPEP_0168590744 /NCGR_PEP_ID=MMETSP0420-20121227/6737_1 /TAXON_ID=498008 /ORGANISM="Pessonella sp." /LENGTH=403 /DNA_ID=CAMNT_0008626435 /DNA_START=52 /DNA_END=1260 /DNA_ORIENTATION=-
MILIIILSSLLSLVNADTFTVTVHRFFADIVEKGKFSDDDKIDPACVFIPRLHVTSTTSVNPTTAKKCLLPPPNTLLPKEVYMDSFSVLILKVNREEIKTASPTLELVTDCFENNCAPPAGDDCKFDDCFVDEDDHRQRASKGLIFQQNKLVDVTVDIAGKYNLKIYVEWRTDDKEGAVLPQTSSIANDFMSPAEGVPPTVITTASPTTTTLSPSNGGATSGEATAGTDNIKATPNASPSSSNGGTIAAVVIVCLLVFICLCGVFIYFLMRKLNETDDDDVVIDHMSGNTGVYAGPDTGTGYPSADPITAGYSSRRDDDGASATSLPDVPSGSGRARGQTSYSTMPQANDFGGAAASSTGYSVGTTEFDPEASQRAGYADVFAGTVDSADSYVTDAYADKQAW